MIRFIDLRQYEEDGVGAFAFFETFSGEFVADCIGDHTFASFEEFESSATEHVRGDIDRYRRLCPAWAFEGGRADG